jgi:hypothetical protein
MPADEAAHKRARMSEGSRRHDMAGREDSRMGIGQSMGNSSAKVDARTTARPGSR